MKSFPTFWKCSAFSAVRNIVASKNVSARITANLYGVTFTEALDAILHVNGYGYIEKGSFIYVYTLEELKTIEVRTRPRLEDDQVELSQLDRRR